MTSCYRDNNFKFEVLKNDRWNVRFGRWQFVQDNPPITSLGKVVDHPPIVFLNRSERQPYYPLEGYVRDNMYQRPNLSNFEVRPSPPMTLDVNQQQSQKFHELYDTRNKVLGMSYPCFMKPVQPHVYPNASVFGTPKDVSVESFLKTLPNYLNRHLLCKQVQKPLEHQDPKGRGNTQTLRKDALTRRNSRFTGTVKVLPCYL